MASSSSGGRSGARNSRCILELAEWAEHVLSLAGERFERRLAQEVSGLELRLKEEMHQGFAALRQEISETRAEWLKWSFLFWIGQLGATAALLAFVLRAR